MTYPLYRPGQRGDLPDGCTARDIDGDRGLGLTEDDLCKNCGNELFDNDVVNGKLGLYCKSCGLDWNEGREVA